MLELLQIQTTVSLEWLIGTALAVLGTGAVAWQNMRVNMMKIETKMLDIEAKVNQDRVDNKELFNKIDVKLDRVLENQTQMSVQVALKEDKK